MAVEYFYDQVSKKTMSFLYVEIQVTSNNLEPKSNVISRHFLNIFEFKDCKFRIF